MYKIKEHKGKLFIVLLVAAACTMSMAVSANAEFQGLQMATSTNDVLNIGGRVTTCANDTGTSQTVNQTTQAPATTGKLVMQIRQYNCTPAGDFVHCFSETDTTSKTEGIFSVTGSCEITGNACVIKFPATKENESLTGVTIENSGANLILKNALTTVTFTVNAACELEGVKAGKTGKWETTETIEGAKSL